jgi:hypothetical protein
VQVRAQLVAACQRLGIGGGGAGRGVDRVTGGIHGSSGIHGGGGWEDGGFGGGNVWGNGNGEVWSAGVPRAVSAEESIALRRCLTAACFLQVHQYIYAVNPRRYI